MFEKRGNSRTSSYEKSKQTPAFYHLQTQKVVTPINVPKVGTARIVNKDVFPALQEVTCYAVEVWEECMRLPHWHPNACELGYVISGSIEVMLWRSPGETAMFTLTPGICWFIPQSALHSLNNIGDEKAVLLVGFSTHYPQDIDMPVAYNGIPVPIRNAYVAPHAELRQWQGVINNPLVGRCPVPAALREVITGSPYGFDLAAVPPLFLDPEMGSVVWGVKSNWSILENISVLRAHLKSGVARDAIWYPDAGTLYIVTQGKGEFHIIIADQDPKPFEVKYLDYIFVPTGVLHTFMNTHKEDFEVIAFFSQENPKPEVSLAVASAFFPNAVRKAAMTEYGKERKSGDPLQDLQYRTVSPFLLRL